MRSIIYLKGLKLFSYYYSALTRKLENQIWNTGMANTLQEMYHILRTFLINSASFIWLDTHPLCFQSIVFILIHSNGISRRLVQIGGGLVRLFSLVGMGTWPCRQSLISAMGKPNVCEHSLWKKHINCNVGFSRMVVMQPTNVKVWWGKKESGEIWKIWLLRPGTFTFQRYLCNLLEEWLKPKTFNSDRGMSLFLYKCLKRG